MTFHEVRFPKTITYGAQGGPSFNTGVQELNSGHEWRNQNWSQDRRKYDVSQAIRSYDNFETLRTFFLLRRGRAYGFRLHDPIDFKITRQVIGQTDAATDEFQIYKRYTDGVYTYDKDIFKIVADADKVTYTFQCWVNDVAVTVVEGASPGASEVAIDRNTGLLTLGSTHAAASGTDIEVQCEFDIPVRFEVDQMEADYVSFELMGWPQIPIWEIRDYE